MSLCCFCSIKETHLKEQYALLNKYFSFVMMQAPLEELSSDELTEINTGLQNQLNQEKNDMQMKSEELNILIRFYVSISLYKSKEREPTLKKKKKKL